MADIQPRPILITGGGRRIGLALARHFLARQQPVIISYRTWYPAIDALREAGAVCLHADFSTDDSILAFAEEVKAHAGSGLRAIIHNASGWMAEKPGVPLTTVLASMMQIHVNAPYLLNHATGEPAARPRPCGQRHYPYHRLRCGARQRQTHCLRRQQSGAG